MMNRMINCITRVSRGRAVVWFCALVSLMEAPPTAAAEKVRFGYCGDDLEKAKQAGFDYVEMPVRDFARLSDEDFAKLLEKHRAARIPTPVGNVFLPGNLKVVGPEIDKAAQMAYVGKTFDRAAKLGLEIIVFGSGGSRRIPEGFSRDEAWKQLVDFGRRIAPEARKRRLVVAVEPLQKRETNTINSAAEGLALVEAVGQPNFQLMVDFYHLSVEKEDSSILVKARKHLRHIHIANPNGRIFPQSPDEYDYSGFFANLRQINYRGGISVEGRTKDFEREGPKALAFLRSAWKDGVKPPARPPAAEVGAQPAGTPPTPRQPTGAPAR
jgi:D-psicose/D-tagatose/L-ribulose 3-epimerase